MKETGILIDKLKREKKKIGRTLKNIAAVAESVCEVSLNISETSLKKILHKHLGMTLYKV